MIESQTNTETGREGMKDKKTETELEEARQKNDDKIWD
jgi:hypothetical protein